MPVDPACFIAIFTSCLTVSVDALASPEAASLRGYAFAPLDASRRDTLEYRELELITNRALQAQGFVPAQVDEDIEVVIVLDWGMRAGTRLVEQPIMGQKSSGTATVTTTSRPSLMGSVTTQGTITQGTTYGVVGSRTVEEDIYHRAVVLTAYEAGPMRDESRAVEVWRVSAASSGSSDNMRAVFPAIMAAMDDYLAKRTDATVSVTTPLRNKEALALQGR